MSWSFSVRLAIIRWWDGSGSASRMGTRQPGTPPTSALLSEDRTFWRRCGDCWFTAVKQKVGACTVNLVTVSLAHETPIWIRPVGFRISRVRCLDQTARTIKILKRVELVATKSTTPNRTGRQSGPYLIDSIGRGGEIRTHDPLRPRHSGSFLSNYLVFSSIRINDLRETVL
jgi:hypothetical protein